MLRGWFGDLPRSRSALRTASDPDFASTAVMDPVDEWAQGVASTGGTSEWLLHGDGRATPREYLGDGEAPAARAHQIVLFDPVELWAGSVLKALSDASGQPVERIELRDEPGQPALGSIERTQLPQRQGAPLVVHHARIHDDNVQAIRAMCTLMERADMAVVIVGPMHSSALQGLLERLQEAAASAQWRCPDLLFLLPVGAQWVAQKVLATAWPAHLHVHTSTEPLPSASVVWNLLLAHWQERAAAATSASLPGSPASAAADSIAPAFTSSGLTTGASISPPTSALTPASPTPVPAQVDAARHADAVLEELMLLDGVVFVALVDATTGRVINSEGSGPDIERAASAAAEILQTHRRTLRQMGHWRPNEPVDEVLVTAGSRYHILRTLQAQPDRFLLAVLDKLRSNLAMTRFRIMEAQQVLD